MNSEPVLRNATTEDLPCLLEFEQNIIAAERPFDKTLREGPINYYDLKTLLKSKDCQIIVAEDEGKLVSSGLVQIVNSDDFLAHRQHGFLAFMYTVPCYRQRGLNRRIIRRLTNWAHDKGVVEFRLEVYEENEAAIKSYLKSGFRNHLIEMRRSW